MFIIFKVKIFQNDVMCCTFGTTGTSFSACLIEITGLNKRYISNENQIYHERYRPGVDTFTFSKGTQ